MSYINTILVASSSSSIANHLQRINYRLFRTQRVFACELLQKHNDKNNLSRTENDPEIFGGGSAPRITFLHTFCSISPFSKIMIGATQTHNWDFKFFFKIFFFN